METYKETKGVTILTKDGDPDVFAGTWASGGNLNRNSRQFASFGTLTAGLVAGGAPGTVPSSTEVEEYNGTAWSEVNDMPSGSFAIGASRNAPQTSGIVFGGVNAANTGVRAEADSYDGTNWTEVAEMNTGRKQLGGSGASSTSALAFGGGYPGTPGAANTETWDGSSWAEVNDLNTARANMGCFGTATAAISAAGTDSTTTAVEQWNGSAWTEVAELNTERARTGGTGTTTDGMVISGGPPNTAKTENWNGSTWTEIADVSTARHEAGSGGTGTDAFIAGGYSTTTVNTTEEFTFPDGEFGFLTEGDLFLSKGTTLKGFGKAAGIPSVAWGSGGNVNTARNSSRGMGTVNTAMIAAGGYDGTAAQAITEQYNGSSWTEVGDMNTAKTQGAAAGQSPYQDSIMFAGSPTLAVAETWNGTSWTEVNDLSTGRQEGGSAGTAGVSALFGLGYTTTRVATSEEFTADNALSTVTVS